MTKKIGEKAEEMAAHYLISLGYEILETNYRSINGEIDLIAKKDNNISCFEVKSRTNLKYGYPEEAVTKSKLLKIWKTYQLYLDQEGKSKDDFKLEVIAISMDNKYNLKDIEKIKL